MPEKSQGPLHEAALGSPGVRLLFTGALKQPAKIWPAALGCGMKRGTDINGYKETGGWTHLMDII